MSGDSNVRSLEKEAFKRRLAALASAKAISDADFADCIYISMTKFGLAEDTFRDAFGLTKGAVERWILLKNLPQSTVRAKILEWMGKEMG